jgi:hypothetical protein
MNKLDEYFVSQIRNSNVLKENDLNENSGNEFSFHHQKSKEDIRFDNLSLLTGINKR